MSYLLSMSGFNFDNNKMMILCEKNVFDEFAEVIFELYGVNFITCLDFMLLATFFNKKRRMNSRILHFHFDIWSRSSNWSKCGKCR